MKGRAIAALVVGICLEILALFGNRGPFPVVRDLLAPEYAAARQGYEKLATEGVLVEGDPGFSEFRRSYMELSLMMGEPPFPIDEMDGMTITRFEAGLQKEPWALKETTPIFGYYSNGEVFLLDLNFIKSMADDRSSGNIVLVNMALLIVGCGLVFYSFQTLFLKETGRGQPDSSQKADLSSA